MLETEAELMCPNCRLHSSRTALIYWFRVVSPLGRFAPGRFAQSRFAPRTFRP